MALGGATSGPSLMEFVKSVSVSTCILAFYPRLDLNEIHFSKKGGESISIIKRKETLMPSEPRKTLRDVYRNIGSGLTLNPEDFGIDLSGSSKKSGPTENARRSSGYGVQNRASKITRNNSPTSNENI